MDILTSYKASRRESLDSDTIENTIRAEQIRLVYRSATLGLLINIGNGLIVTLIFTKAMIRRSHDVIVRFCVRPPYGKP